MPIFFNWLGNFVSTISAIFTTEQFIIYIKEKKAKILLNRTVSSLATEEQVSEPESELPILGNFDSIISEKSVFRQSSSTTHNNIGIGSN